MMFITLQMMFVGVSFFPVHNKTSENAKLGEQQIPVEKFPSNLCGVQVSPHSKLRHCSVHTANSMRIIQGSKCHRYASFSKGLLNFS